MFTVVHICWQRCKQDITGWGENDRGVSFTFGGDVVRQFLKKHNFSLIVRAHQVRVCFSFTFGQNLSLPQINFFLMPISGSFLFRHCLGLPVFYIVAHKALEFKLMPIV